jgi:flavin reductase (DIM6/NTAB) family NADH-FMN oxidoreductase RutF
MQPSQGGQLSRRRRVARKGRQKLETRERNCYKEQVLGPDEFRRVLGHLATGVTVVTTLDVDGRPAGLTASAVTSVSLDPPLILVCVAHTAQSYSAFVAHGKFAVNLLHADHEAVARRFASSGGGAEKFESIGYRQGALGLPILKDALAEIECTLVHSYPAGDHTIFVGQVEAADCHGDTGLEPLLYYRGRFSRLQSRGDA